MGGVEVLSLPPQLSFLPPLGPLVGFCRRQREEAAIRHSGAQLFSEEVAAGPQRWG